MPVPQYQQYQGQAPTCFDKMKTGFKMGFFIGLASGALLSGFTGLRWGLRGRELLHNTARGMLTHGATFGTFMTIGQGMRC